MAYRLTIDPAGTPDALDVTYPCIRLASERTRRASRQQMMGIGWSSSVSAVGLTRPSGVLRLLLTDTEREWFHDGMETLLGGARLRYTPDSSDAGTYTEVVLDGEVIEERYARTFAGIDGPWSIDLEVLIMAEEVS